MRMKLNTQRNTFVVRKGINMATIVALDNSLKDLG